MDISQYDIPGDVRELKRKELCLQEKDFALISMGDLIKRKNYAIAIEVIAKMKNPKIHYFICGKGPEEGKLRELAKKYGVEKQVHFMGYRRDIKELLKSADAFLFTSKQEGLARSLMEAMASGLPCVVSDIRGNSDLISNNINGNLCNNVNDYIDSITNLIQSPESAKLFVQRSLDNLNKFSIEKVEDSMFDIYTKELV